MQHPIVSIIIPVYNGGAYIRPCIDSILHQTCEDWELLLIDDGSTDDSGKICDEYTTDPRIRVIHKSNAGPAAARNDGIKQARGQFISFVDCDDWIEPDMYQTMLSKMHDNQRSLSAAISRNTRDSRKKSTTMGQRKSTLPKKP